MPKKQNDINDPNYWYAFQVYRYSFELKIQKERTDELRGHPDRIKIHDAMINIKVPTDVLINWYKEKLDAGAIQHSKDQPLTSTPVR